MTKQYKVHIDQQIKHNESKNLYFENVENIFCFTPQTINYIHTISHINHDDQQQLIQYIVQKVLQEFCRINQYISFTSRDKDSLSDIYCKLFDEINNNPETVASKHYQNIRKWLTNTNPFLHELYSGKDIYLQPVCCSQYSAQLQLELLHIDLAKISQPILDIGCGQQATLVHYLQKAGFEVHGIDRFCNNTEITQNADWLEYNYKEKYWGTIISNLGFSNHFQNNHLRKDGDYITYARK